MSPLPSYWATRSEGERTLWISIGALVALVLIIVLAWLPLERSRTRLSAELPRARASLEGMRRDAAEAKRLRAMPQSVSNAQAPIAALANAPAPGTQVTALDARRVRISGSDVAFNAILQWILAAEASHGLRVESARLDALPAPGRVKADVVLSRS